VQSEWLQARYAAQQDDQHYDQLQTLEMDDSQVYALVFSVDALIPALYLKISKGSRPTSLIVFGEARSSDFNVPSFRSRFCSGQPLSALSRLRLPVPVSMPHH
jgi:hypothetical protein